MRANRNLLGIASLIFGVMLFSTQDAIIKSISHDHAVTLAMAIRCIVALPLLLLLVHFECGIAKLRSPLFWALVMRGGILLVAYTTYYMGLAGPSAGRGHRPLLCRTHHCDHPFGADAG